eukprot:13517439-Ditylum_brightwellii.AAC.1
MDIQGGIDKAFRHRYSSSAEASNESQDTLDIITTTSRDVRDGGRYKIGNLNVTAINQGRKCNHKVPRGNIQL